MSDLTIGGLIFVICLVLVFGRIKSMNKQIKSIEEKLNLRLKHYNINQDEDSNK